MIAKRKRQKAEKPFAIHKTGGTGKAVRGCEEQKEIPNPWRSFARTAMNRGRGRGGWRDTGGGPPGPRENCRQRATINKNMRTMLKPRESGLAGEERRGSRGTQRNGNRLQHWFPTHTHIQTHTIKHTHTHRRSHNEWRTSLKWMKKQNKNFKSFS